MDGSCCWLSPGMLAMPTMPYYVAVSGHGAKLPTVSDWSNTKTRHGEKWPCTHRSPPGRLAWRERHRRSTCCCYGTPSLPGCIRLFVLACAGLHGCGLSRFALTQRFPPTLPSFAGWPGAGGRRGTGTATTTTCFGRCSCSLAPAPVPCTWRMEVLGQAPRHGLLSQFLWPQSLGLAWMLRQRSWLLDVDSSLQFSDRARWRWLRGGTPAN